MKYNTAMDMQTHTCPGKNYKQLKIGSAVQTIHGTGIIVGKDLPESRAWRWIVEIAGKRLCYFPREVELTIQNKEAPKK